MFYSSQYEYQVLGSLLIHSINTLIRVTYCINDLFTNSEQEVELGKERGLDRQEKFSSVF